MKLRNKKTGEINLGDLHLDDFNSLAELNAEWEDYEEPKEYWYLTGIGEIGCIEDNDVKFDKDRKEIGNYFETREEAERAVEKLKACKRLKDKGFRFTGIAGLKSEIYFCADEKYDNAHIMFDEYGSSSDDLKQYNKDLDLLFRGEVWVN